MAVACWSPSRSKRLLTTDVTIPCRMARLHAANQEDPLDHVQPCSRFMARRSRSGDVRQKPSSAAEQPWIFGGLSAVFDGSLFQMAALSNMRQTITNPANASAAGQILATQIAKLATGYTHVFSPSTIFGKDLMSCSRVGIFTV